MASDHLNKAFAAADRMVAFAKAATTDLPGMLASGEKGSLVDQHSRITNAAEMYSHNRAWVYSCVRLVAQRVAGQTIHVAKIRTAPSGDSLLTKSLSRRLPLCFKSMADHLEPLDSHPLITLLNDPWELGTAWGMIFGTVASLELTGRALWYVTEEDGRPTIFPIPISWLEQVDRKRTKWTVRIPGSATPIDLPGDQVSYFFYPDPANPWGALSPLGAIARAVNADESIEIAQNQVFSRGMFPGVVMKVGALDMPAGVPGTGQRPTLTPEQRNQLINAARKMYGGVFNRHEPFILDGLIESVEPFTLTPAELDFLNSAKLTKSRILQGFGVSPILLGEVEGANRASATVADEIFCANKVGPLCELLSQCLTEWLGPMFAGKGEKLIVYIDPPVAHDHELTGRNYAIALARKAVTKNEYRSAVLNLGPIDGGDELDSDSAPAIDPAAVKALLDASDPYTSPRINGHKNRLEKLLGYAARAQ